MLPPVLDGFSLVQGLLDAPGFGGSKNKGYAVSTHGGGLGYLDAVMSWLSANVTQPVPPVMTQTVPPVGPLDANMPNTTLPSFDKSCSPVFGNWLEKSCSALADFDRYCRYITAWSGLPRLHSSCPMDSTPFRT